MDLISTLKHLFFRLGGDRAINLMGAFMFQEPALFLLVLSAVLLYPFILFLILFNNHKDEFSNALKKKP